MQRMLAAGIEFTAVLASNDESAIGVLRALAAAGHRVPHDIAVIGFDDVLYARGLTPPLTTVQHPTFELGYRAVELVLDCIHGRVQGTPTIRVPTRLVIRESCGCQPYSINPAMRHETDLPLWEAVYDAVATEAHTADRILLQQWARALVDAFHHSITQASAHLFTATIDQLLQAMEATQADSYAWQAGLSVLRAYVLGKLHTAPTQPLALQLIDQARVQISERIRRQHTSFVVRQADLTDRLATMTSRLLTALEPQQILNILADHLPQIGIQHAHIGWYAAEDDDPVAWSELYQRTSSQTHTVQRFRTRQFPPSSLIDVHPFSLALLPLVIEDGPRGFVAFDAAYLEPLGFIVRHLAAAFRNAHLHAAAEEGRRQAEAASQLKSRFLSTVSHELRTPLSLIVGLSEMLVRDHDLTASAAVREDLQRIHLHAQQLSQLIGDVLDLASSEAGQLRLVYERLDLIEALQPALATGAQLAQAKGLEWHTDLPHTSLWVWGDRTRLRQIALNLIGNAVKFTERGSISIAITIEHGQARIAISDTGPGVPLADQNHIFDEFHRSERTMQRGYSGLGLGLAICKQLIERHGGTIGVCSSGAEDGGATFFFTLPLLDTALDAECAPASEQRLAVLLTTKEPTDATLSALLAEHAIDLRVIRIDTDHGWLTELFNTPPAVILLDQSLAQHQGWELIALLKQHPLTARIPMVMLGLQPQQTLGSLLQLDYLVKPLNIEDLESVLGQQLLRDQPSATAKTILIVDDEPDILALHTRLIRQILPQGRVLQARNGHEALTVLHRQHPDLVLLDLMMPHLDGFAVLEAIRSQPAMRAIPVIVLTAQTLTAQDMARLNSGVAAVLSKGVYSTTELGQRIAAVIGQQRRLGSNTQQIVRQAAALIHTHYAEALTREQIASQLGVHPDYLTAIFRQEMGITPITYLNRYRVYHARKLLEESTQTITAIALAVGFGDLATFSRTFHREVGMSPNAYRRMYRR